MIRKGSKTNYLLVYKMVQQKSVLNINNTII